MESFSGTSHDKTNPNSTNSDANKLDLGHAEGTSKDKTKTLDASNSDPRKLDPGTLVASSSDPRNLDLDHADEGTSVDKTNATDASKLDLDEGTSADKTNATATISDASKLDLDEGTSADKTNATATISDASKLDLDEGLHVIDCFAQFFLNETMTLWSELKYLEEKKNSNLNLCAISLFRSSISEFSSTRPCFGCENDPLVIFSRLPPNAKQIWVNKATEIIESSKSQTWEYLAEEESLEDTNVELFKVCAESVERFNDKHQIYATKWELFLVYKLLLEDIYQYYMDLSDVTSQKHLSCAMTLYRNKTMVELLHKNTYALQQNKITAELLRENLGAEVYDISGIGTDLAWRLRASEEDKKHFLDVAEEICNVVGTATDLVWQNLLSNHHLTSLDSEDFVALKVLFDKVASQEELYQIICVNLLSVDWSV